jgi:hypothetical protein
MESDMSEYFRLLIFDSDGTAVYDDDLEADNLEDAKDFWLKDWVR